jgi:hypothetical protein
MSKRRKQVSAATITSPRRKRLSPATEAGPATRDVGSDVAALQPLPRVRPIRMRNASLATSWKASSQVLFRRSQL